MTLRRLVFAVVLALALGSLVTPSPALEKLKVGVAASVENQVEGVLENSIEKLGEGSEVFFKQLVRTGEASKANLRFLDDTNLDVWPKTEIRLDSFIYQPGKKSGSVVLNVPLGYVRFATGALSPKSYTINTPLGFIGIRGTEFDLVVKSDRLTARLLRGEIRITALDRRVFWLRTPNAAITIHRDGRVNGPRNWSGDVLEFAALPGPAPRAASIPRATGRHTIVNSDTTRVRSRRTTATSVDQGDRREGSAGASDRGQPRSRSATQSSTLGRSATQQRDVSPRNTLQSAGPRPAWRTEDRAIITRPTGDRPK